MAINRIHVFESRDKAFNEGDVLQENIIIQAKKTSKSAEKTIITSNDNPEDVDVLVRETGFDQLVQPGDPYLFIRLIPDQIGNQINSRINRLPATLKELGITVSTGRVVDFRAKNLLRYVPDKEVIPLIYPGNLQNGLVQWPKPNSRKPSCLVSTTDIDNLAIPSQYYVLVKRFSSKEEKRRVYAALYDPLRIPAKRVGFENHINYFHKRYGAYP
jgi:adenine-specific DNA-methyltransferase